MNLRPSFAYEAGELGAERVPFGKIAAAAGTPCYVYAAGGIRQRYRALDEALAVALGRRRPLICYAVKANHNLAVIRTLAGLGAGADTVSAGEVLRALAAGVPPERIVMAGVAKDDDELRAALAAGIHQVNVESAGELHRLGAVAAAMGRRAAVALRINPDIGAGGHDKITTGRKGDKFGVPFQDALAVLDAARDHKGLHLVGLHLHIGSQIHDPAPFRAAFARVGELYRAGQAAGLPLARLDLGGGLGVAYADEAVLPVEAYARLVAAVATATDAELTIEPGRWLVAEAGALLTRVVAVKPADGRRFVFLDAGMQTLMRPALYGARHPVLPVRQPAAAATEAVDLVGPICESSDVLGRDYALPPLAEGDLVAVLMAGAYGAVMGSDYNSRPRAAEVLVDGERFAIVRRRREPAEIMAEEDFPGWLPAPAGEAAAAWPRARTNAWRR